MGDELRKSYRCATPVEAAPARLQVGTRQYNVCLIDESAGGFRLQVDPAVKLTEGQQVELESHLGSCVAVVRHVERGENSLLVGLQRLNHDAPAPLRQIRTSGRSWFRAPRFDVVGVFVVFAVLGTALALASTGRLGDVLVLAGLKLDPQWNHQQPATKEETAQAAVGGQLDRRVRALNSFSDPEILQGLDLSDAQRQTVRAIFDDTSRQLAALYEKTGRSDPTAWTNQSARLVDRALVRLVSTLTQEQIQQWIVLLPRTAEANAGAAIESR